MDKVLKMFIAFFKIGAFTFGGGYAMIPIIEEEVVNKQKWVSKEEFMDMLVVSQSFPGAMSINCSIFIGYKIAGVLGGVIALLGVALPSFLIILIVATFFMKFRENYYVNLVFKGISAAVPVLVLTGVISLAKGIDKNIRNGITIVLALIALVIFKINPIIVIIVAAIYGAAFLRKKVK
ncbi:chromate transporter [Clostridium moniliforme]|uniref:Chromate transporter n=1 Tax=Clostridium moniliforme TaxID=39489 RepID=A0ABS4F196_9CLOT|nr:chromate transporter [Clostridium moniliforme]MBP1890020.1 chromate transporter [Clostridium moniliforme]